MVLMQIVRSPLPGERHQHNLIAAAVVVHYFQFELTQTSLITPKPGWCETAAAHQHNVIAAAAVDHFQSGMRERCTLSAPDEVWLMSGWWMISC